MAKDESVAIERLVLDVGGKKVELTVDQAKRLHGALAELFADKTKVEHHYDRWPWRWPHSYSSLRAQSGAEMTFDNQTHSLSCKV